jgi:GNAT superfamily N-acetyltransferase
MVDVNVMIRRAQPGDRTALLELQAAWLRRVGRHHYSAEAIEAFIAAGTLDPTLIDDRTYFVLESSGRIMGCGGWSVRQPAYTRTTPLGLDDGAVPKVRAVYVHPDFVRQGVCGHLMTYVEAEITRAGFSRATLTSTLGALPFYRAIGYRGDAPVVLNLPGRHTFVCIGMEKRLSRGDLRHAA